MKVKDLFEDAVESTNKTCNRCGATLNKVTSGNTVKLVCPKCKTTWNAGVKESIVTEGVHLGVMQQTIFDFVIKKLKALNTTFHTSYAQELARTTDSFWTPQFDNLHNAFNTSTDIDEVEDELQKTLEAVSNVICDYFADEMNHPTGYQSRRMQGIDYDSATMEEVDALIKKIDPQLKKDLENRV